jgi:hypothetical protein
MNWPSRQRNSFQRSAWRLLGHLTIGTLVFVAVLLLTWILSFSFKYLNSVNPFPLEIARLFSKLEIGLFYADIIFGCIVLVIGILRFLWGTVMERDR